MAALGTGVVVWEWLGARWIPYEPHVSDCIEDMHNLVNSNGLNFGGTVLPSTQFSLDSVDSSLAGVVIDLSTMQQISKSASKISYVLALVICCKPHERILCIALVIIVISIKLFSAKSRRFLV